MTSKNQNRPKIDVFKGIQNVDTLNRVQRRPLGEGLGDRKALLRQKNMRQHIDLIFFYNLTFLKFQKRKVCSFPQGEFFPERKRGETVLPKRQNFLRSKKSLQVWGSKFLSQKKFSPIPDSLSNDGTVQVKLYD